MAGTVGGLVRRCKSSNIVGEFIVGYVISGGGDGTATLEYNFALRNILRGTRVLGNMSCSRGVCSGMVNWCYVT